MRTTLKIYKKVAAVACGLLLFSGVVTSFNLLALPAHTVFAADSTATDNKCPDGTPKLGGDPCIPNDITGSSSDPAESGTCKLDCIVNKYVNPFTKVLSGLVGVVAAASLVYAGIQYASSAGDPSKVQDAKQRILKTVIGLLAYLFMFAFLQWLIPGGIF